MTVGKGPPIGPWPIRVSSSRRSFAQATAAAISGGRVSVIGFLSDSGCAVSAGAVDGSAVTVERCSAVNYPPVCGLPFAELVSDHCERAADFVEDFNRVR